jgi:hypothetical protein
MRKYIIFLLGVIVLFIALTYVKLFTKQTEYRQELAASTNSVLFLDNFDKSKVKIVTADTDKITYDLRGSAQDILNLIQSEGGDMTGMDGTITVPKGMLLDVSLSGAGTVDINDPAGKKTINGRDSFLVDTANLDSFEVGELGNVTLNGLGNLIVWDDEKWDVLSNLTDAGNADSGTGGLPYCGVGSQIIRNYCCKIQKKDADTPVCIGTGIWVFDNSERNCTYSCEISGNGPANSERDCGVGSQTVRNNCCAQRFAGQHQGCVGSWNYNNAGEDCEFVCSNGQPLVEGNGNGNGNGDGGGGGGLPKFSYGDPTSDFCSTIKESPAKDTCCNDALKNNLSSGPHPGYPDCIGTWIFDIDAGCKFKCAEYTEMMRILDEVRQRAQQNQ